MLDEARVITLPVCAAALLATTILVGSAVEMPRIVDADPTASAPRYVILHGATMLQAGARGEVTLTVDDPLAQWTSSNDIVMLRDSASSPRPARRWSFLYNAPSPQPGQVLVLARDFGKTVITASTARGRAAIPIYVYANFEFGCAFRDQHVLQDRGSSAPEAVDGFVSVPGASTACSYDEPVSNADFHFPYGATMLRDDRPGDPEFPHVTAALWKNEFTVANGASMVSRGHLLLYKRHDGRIVKALVNYSALDGLVGVEETSDDAGTFPY